MQAGIKKVSATGLPCENDRVAAMRCALHPEKYMTVSGLNTMAYTELSMDSDLSIEKLADRAIETTKKSVGRFPE